MEFRILWHPQKSLFRFDLPPIAHHKGVKQIKGRGKKQKADHSLDDCAVVFSQHEPPPPEF